MNVVAAMAGGTTADDGYVGMSGTSMATPHVAGAAAILFQQHPDWTADTTELDFGLARWTDGKRPPVNKTITYRNPGGEPVTLHLKHNASRGKTNAPAPEGLFRLSADTVTVPAHGTADVTLTAAPEAATTYAAYSGVVTAATADNAVGDDHIEGVYATPTAQYKDSKFTYLVSTVWGDPTGADGNPSSVYYLTRPVHGAIPVDPAYTPRKSELAKVTTTFAATTPGTTAARLVWMYVDSIRFGGRAMEGLPVPTRRVDYFSAAEGLRWQTAFDQNNIFDPDTRGQSYLGVPHGYKAGAEVEERWNGGIQGIGISPEMTAFREGDTMFRPFQSAANGNLDLVADTTSGLPKVELRRNGELVSEDWSMSDVPADATPADYRLTVEHDRDLAPSSVSTSLRAEWRFRSQTTATRQALPLYAVRMSPELDEWNRAKAGRALDIPVLIQRTVGAVESPIRTLTVEVSYDEGRTWQSAGVKGSGLQRAVTVDSPRRAAGGSVSLRAYVKDAAGNSFKQTVIKANLLK